MGEFAGYALDEVMDHEDDRLRYKLGGMSDQRAYDLGIIDELGYEYNPGFRTRYVRYTDQNRTKPNTKTISCKYCGCQGLQWKQWAADNSWRLFAFTADTPHVCSKYRKKNNE